MTERYEDKQRMTLESYIGKRLKFWRQRVGHSHRTLADALKFNYSYLVRVESGTQLPSQALATAIDGAIDTGDEFVDLVEMVHGGTIQPYRDTAAKRESVAEHIRVFHSGLIPSLLQTEEYARTYINMQKPKSPEIFKEDLAERIARKSVFKREVPPLYCAVVDEVALRRVLHSPSLMADQCAALIEAAQHPDITIHILPLDAGAYWITAGSLTLLTAPNGKTIAYVQSFDSGELVESPRRVAELTDHFELVRSMALPEKASLDLVKKYMEGYRC